MTEANTQQSSPQVGAMLSLLSENRYKSSNRTPWRHNGPAWLVVWSENSRFLPRLQSFPMQQLCKQSYLVLPGNRNSLASILSRKIGGRNTDYFSHLLNTLRPPRNRGFQLCFAVAKHTRRRSSKIWNRKRFSEGEFKRLGFLSTALALLSYISQGHCPRPLRRFERNWGLTLFPKGEIIYERKPTEPFFSTPC